MTILNECVVAFPVSGGIFGLSRLANRLTALVGRGEISAWHPGDWVGWPHVTINIVFDTRTDADFARVNCTGGTGADAASALAPVVAV